MHARRRRIPSGALKVWVPDVRQRRDDTCGAAALLAVGRAVGCGPTDEQVIARDMRMDRRGSDPAHLIRAARRYGLAVAEHRGMSDAELRGYLDRRVPVILMLQAWGDRRDYRAHWRDGHWVVAIGHDRRGLYVEDPLLAGERGFLAWRELAARWHDVEGRADRHVVRYGLACWSPARAHRRPGRSTAERSARIIDG